MAGASWLPEAMRVWAIGASRAWLALVLALSLSLLPNAAAAAHWLAEPCCCDHDAESATRPQMAPPPCGCVSPCDLGPTDAGPAVLTKPRVDGEVQANDAVGCAAWSPRLRVGGRTQHRPPPGWPPDPPDLLASVILLR